MAMGDVEVDYTKLCSELELQEQEVACFRVSRPWCNHSFPKTLHTDVS